MVYCKSSNFIRILLYLILVAITLIGCGSLIHTKMTCYPQEMESHKKGWKYRCSVRIIERNIFGIRSLRINVYVTDSAYSKLANDLFKVSGARARDIREVITWKSQD